jgi:hypothetical protein
MCHLLQYFPAISLHYSVFFLLSSRDCPIWLQGHILHVLGLRDSLNIQSEHRWTHDRLQTMTFMHVGMPVLLAYTKGTAECDWDTVLKSICSTFRFTWRVNSANSNNVPVPVAVRFRRSLRPLASWDCGFEYDRRHGCLSVVSVVCCKVEVFPTTSWWVFLRSAIDWGASCVI